MKATILDTVTGLVGVHEGKSSYEWMDGNYSCDCNRDVWTEHTGGTGTCVGSKRFLVIEAELEPGDTTVRDLRELNQDYPDELLDRYLAQGTTLSSIPAVYRLFDLVRYARAELHDARLISNEEYVWLCSDAAPVDGSTKRMETYDEARRKLETDLADLNNRYTLSHEALEEILGMKCCPMQMPRLMGDLVADLRNKAARLDVLEGRGFGETMVIPESLDFAALRSMPAFDEGYQRGIDDPGYVAGEQPETIENPYAVGSDNWQAYALGYRTAIS